MRHGLYVCESKVQHFTYRSNELKSLDMIATHALDTPQIKRCLLFSPHTAIPLIGNFTMSDPRIFNCERDKCNAGELSM